MFFMSHDIPNHSCKRGHNYLPFDEGHLTCPGMCGYSAEYAIPDMPLLVVREALKDPGWVFPMPVSNSEVYTNAVLTALRVAENRRGSIILTDETDMAAVSAEAIRKLGIAGGYRQHMQDFVSAALHKVPVVVGEMMLADIAELRACHGDVLKNSA
jgi:hypothetical protein